MMNWVKMILSVGVAAVIATAAQAQPTPGQNVASGAAPPAANALTLMSTALSSSDLDRSVAFYTKGLGMTAGDRTELGQLTEVPLMFPGGGPRLLLIKPKAERAQVQAHGGSGRIVLAVPDLKALEAQLTAAGYHLKDQIHEEAQYHVAWGAVQDPDDNLVELVQRTQ